MGVSYRTRRVEVDYAFLLPIGTLESNQSHRVALNFRFGRPGEREESLELVLDAMRQLKYGALPSRSKLKALSDEQRVLAEEYLSQARSMQAAARYKDALDKFGQALALAPSDQELMAQFGRLNFVGRQVPELPGFQSDPAQAALHQGILAYLSADNAQAVAKVSEAAAQKPGDAQLGAFLSQLETATGLKRLAVAKSTEDYELAVKLTRANSAVEAKDYDKAIDLSYEVLRQDPANAGAWENVGTAFFALKDYESSHKAWKQALKHEKSPAIRTAIQGHLRSVSRAKETQPKTALRAPAPLPEGPRLSPVEVQKLFEQGIQAYISRDLPKARGIFEDILRSDPENVEARKALQRIKDETP
jgi:tetratricopeptide (TPR) repeat protein